MNRPLVAGAALAVAALAAPVHAAPPAPSSDLVYTVSASHATRPLDATCVFRPDRWTADYGPTYVDGYAATTALLNHTSVRCLIYSWGDLRGDVWGSGTGVAVIQGERAGAVGTRPNIRVCVEAYTASLVIDDGWSVANCVTP